MPRTTRPGIRNGSSELVEVTGEAGTAGAVGAILNAVNDAIAPLDASIAETPITPPRLLMALQRF